MTTTVACALLLVVAAPVFGLPALHAWWRVAAALALGALGFVAIGVALGSVLPTALSAQAVGLLIFFPSFLLGAGGPPPHVMGSAVRAVAGPLPLTLPTNAVREPWHRTHPVGVTAARHQRAGRGRATLPRESA